MVPGVELTLADGQAYIFPPLALGSLELLQKRLTNYKGGMDAESIETVITAALHSLNRNYPAITRRDIKGVFHENEDGDLIWDRPPLLDIGNMIDVMNAIMDVSGIQRKTQEAKKATAGSS
jgi:hypothetical protein